MTTTRLFALDISVLALYLVVVVGKGVLLGRRQKGVMDYFLAGRKMGWFMVAISIYASLFSAISYLGGATESFFNELQYPAIALVKPMVLPLLLIVFLPFYYKPNIYRLCVPPGTFQPADALGSQRLLRILAPHMDGPSCFRPRPGFV